MSLESKFIKKYLSKNNEVPFKIIMKDGEVLEAGSGKPKFIIRVNDNIDKKLLLTSTSLALGEAYMDKKLKQWDFSSPTRWAGYDM